MAALQVMTSRYPGLDTPAPELIFFSPSFPACSSAPSAVTIVLAVIGSVVLIGTILLGLWKLLVTIHDRREFDRFQSERSRARYEMVSPGVLLGLWGGSLSIAGSKQLCSDGEKRWMCVLCCLEIQVARSTRKHCGEASCPWGWSALEGITLCMQMGQNVGQSQMQLSSLK